MDLAGEAFPLWLPFPVAVPFFLPVTAEILDQQRRFQGRLDAGCLEPGGVDHVHHRRDIETVGGIGAVIVTRSADGLVQAVHHVGVHPERLISAVHGQSGSPMLALLLRPSKMPEPIGGLFLFPLLGIKHVHRQDFP